MKKQNIYYMTFYGRNNILKRVFLSFFFNISSYPRLLSEVFLHREMGIRYFSLFHSLCVVLTMLAVPTILSSGYEVSIKDQLLHFWGWYSFILAFAFFSWKRYLETRTRRGVYDFDHFTLGAGKHLPFVNDLTINGEPVSPRAKDVYIEPIIVASVALTFILLDQSMIGWLLLVCALIHSLSYAAAYEMGRQLLLDEIDGGICNRSLTNIFLNDEPPVGNFEFYGPKPSSEEVRKRVAPLLTKVEEDEDSIVK